MAKSRAVTSNDVARQTGVSRATVSTVLSGAEGNIRVSDETRRRVLAAAAELGYSPHPLAQALRRQRSGVLGFVPRSSRTTPYEHPVPYLLAVQIAQAAMRRGYHVVEASAETTASRASDELARFLLDRRVDGVLFDSPETAAEVRRFTERGLPVVQLIRPQLAVATPAITVDAAPGIAAALDHLAGLGHRRIAFLGHGGPHPVDRIRRDTFTATLARHGLAAPDAWLRLVDDYSIEEGYAAARALLALPERPTALFAAGDNLALGVLQALYEARLRVPDDLSLVSYDDIFAAHLPPPLTSVVQPLREVAERAIATIAAQLDRGEVAAGEPIPIALPTHLVARASTRPPRADSDEGL